MATVPSLRVVKTFQFKGGNREWSNRYHFTGGVPADATHWTTLSDNVVNAEKAILGGHHQITATWGYLAGSDVPVFNKTYTTTGTHVKGGQYAPGEVCAIERWSTNSRSTKNHPIYLFSYYHSPDIFTGTNQEDSLYSTLATAMDTYAAAWVTGFSDGAITAKRSSPRGATATGAHTGEYVTHRDFPYTTSV